VRAGTVLEGWGEWDRVQLLRLRLGRRRPPCLLRNRVDFLIDRNHPARIGGRTSRVEPRAVVQQQLAHHDREIALINQQQVERERKKKKEKKISGRISFFF